MRFFLLTAVAVTIATPACAQDREDFSGFHLELLGGYDHIAGDGEDAGGFTYGIAGGYDLPLGRFRIGAELEATESTTRHRTSIAPIGDVVDGGRLRSDMGRDLYLGLRAGYVVSPSAMIYAKAGYSNARVTAHYTSGTTTTKEAANLDGFRAGAGVEVAIAPRIFVKGEYRYSHYSDQDGIEADMDRHQLMAGVGIRF